MSLIQRIKERAEYRRHAADWRLVMTFRPGVRHFVYDMCQQTGLRSGTAYPSLVRLESRGWITSGWEDPPPSGRPRRRWYALTPAGEWEMSSHVIPVTQATRRPGGRRRPSRPGRPATSPQLARRT